MIRLEKIRNNLLCNICFTYKLYKSYMRAKLEIQLKNYYFTEKSFENINNQPRNSHSGPLFKKRNILKL